VSAVPITHKLVERLMKAYPKQIAGMKDSSDDWPHTKSMIDAFAKDGFDVFSGNEKPLIDNIKSGGAGCISATANINPGKIAETYHKYTTPEGEKLQTWINDVRGVMQGYGVDAGPSAAGRDRREGRQGHDRQARQAGLHHAGPEAGDGGGRGIGALSRRSVPAAST
jgi:dihydrodipicolinate synthase/N-acetylneuraminate lyase